MVRILVLEDDARLNQTVCTYLNDSGFQAKGCLHANDAYEEMYNCLYDMIGSDIMLPDADGFEFAENVRRVNRHIPMRPSVNRFNQVTLHLKRDRRIINKMELTRLQRNFEACAREIDKLERAKTSAATAWSIAV